MIIFYEITDNLLNYSYVNQIQLVEKYEFDEEVQKTIQNFNELYSWDEMFDQQEVETRLNTARDRFFVYKYENNVVGHTWVSPNITIFNPKKVHYNKIPQNTLYIYNVFVDKRHKTPTFDSNCYVSNLCHTIFNENYEKIILYVDEWADLSKRYFEKIGFQQTKDYEIYN